MRGVVVSNHAGRQVDGAVASLDALEEITKGGFCLSGFLVVAGAETVAVGDKTTVIYDSGIRLGSGVFKALALGAKVVFVGRLFIWGLSIQGEYGVGHMVKSLLAEFDPTVELAGYNRVDEIGKHSISKFKSPSNVGVGY